jgi:hypothetical protein
VLACGAAAVEREVPGGAAARVAQDAADDLGVVGRVRWHRIEEQRLLGGRRVRGRQRDGESEELHGRRG